MLQPATYDGKAEYSLLSVPVIKIAPQAAHTMLLMTRRYKTEVAWFGLVTREGHTFTIEEVLVPYQEASHSTVEIQPSHFADFATEVLDTRGDEAYDKLRLWGHSHHTMTTGPSAQDDATLERLAKATGDYFIAVRTNHRHEMEFDVIICGELQARDVDYETLLPAMSDEDPFLAILDERVQPFKPKPKPLPPVGGKGKVVGVGGGVGAVDDWQKDWRHGGYSDHIPGYVRNYYADEEEDELLVTTAASGIGVMPDDDEQDIENQIDILVEAFEAERMNLPTNDNGQPWLLDAETSQLLKQMKQAAKCEEGLWSEFIDRLRHMGHLPWGDGR